MVMILITLLVLATVGSFPSWTHSSGWGYGPSGGLGVALVLLVLYLLLHGRL